MLKMAAVEKKEAGYDMTSRLYKSLRSSQRGCLRL